MIKKKYSIGRTRVCRGTGGGIVGLKLDGREIGSPKSKTKRVVASSDSSKISSNRI